MRPVILTNAFLRPRATRLSSGLQLCEKTNVYACVEELVRVICNELGATPLMLPTCYKAKDLPSILAHVDGLLLPGAASNIHPSQYGEKPNGMPQTFDQEHDEADISLLREAYKKKMPVLAICRSMQAMNLAFGGTLNQKLPSSEIDHMCSGACDGHVDLPSFMHDISVHDGGLLANVFKKKALKVNSIHEQSIQKIGRGLKSEASAEDGLIEAISAQKSDTFFLGVQWHPEAMPKHPVSKKLFLAFRKEVWRHWRDRQASLKKSR